MFEKFMHDEQEFEIRNWVDDGIIRVKVFLGDEPMSKEYYAKFDVEEYEALLGNLKALARNDIEKGLRFNEVEQLTETPL